MVLSSTAMLRLRDTFIQGKSILGRKVHVWSLIGGDEHANEGENDRGGDHAMGGVAQSLAEWTAEGLIDKPDETYQVYRWVVAVCGVCGRGY